MKTTFKLLAVTTLLATASCAPKPQLILESTNKDIKLELMFTHDGCRMYRFHDGGRHVYWSDCRGKTEVAYKQTTVVPNTQNNSTVAVVQVVPLEVLTTTQDSLAVNKN